MLKNLLLLLLFMSISIPSYAEIITFQNSFDRTTHTISFNKYKNQIDPKFDNVKEIALKKIHNQNNTEYYLFFRYSGNALSPVEHTKIRIDDVHIGSFSSNIVEVTNQWPEFSINLPISFIEKINSAKSIQIQFPTTSATKQFVKYGIIEIPQPVLNEWKQVITME